MRIAKKLAEYWKKRGMPEYDEKWAQEYIKEGHHKEFTHSFHETKDGSIYSLIRDVSGLVEIRDALGDHEKIIDEVLKKRFRKTTALVFEEEKSLYERKGFVCEGELKNHFKKGETLYVMSYETIS